MLKRIFLTVLLAGVAGFASAGSLKDVTGASGVNIHFTDAKAGELEMMAAAGFRNIRMDLTWGSTEKTKGVYDFSAYERLTASLEKHGMRPYYILDYSNKLYEEERSVRTEEGRVAFTKWALAAVEKFKGRGICWEVWNEPNLLGFWRPKADVKEYAALAVMVSKAIKERYPDEFLCGPATSSIDMTFLEECFKAGLLEWWDAVSVHPYRQTGPESVAAEYVTLRRLIGKYQPQGKPPVQVLAGEWGYSVAWMNHDADTQGRMLARQWLVNAGSGIPVSIWYDWRDDGPDPKEAEHNFGTVKLDYHKDRDPVFDPKPSYHAAKTFNTVLRGHRLVKALSLGNMEHQALLFRDEAGKVLVAAWSTRSGTHTVTLPSDDGKFTVTGHLGDALGEAVAKDGKVELAIDGAPRYFAFQAGNDKLASAAEGMLVKLAIAPVSGKEVLVKIENFSGKPFEAKVSVKGSGLAVDGENRTLAVPAGEGVTDVVFPLKEVPEVSYEAGATMEIGGQVALEIPPRKFSPTDDAVLEGARVVGEGDAKVAATFALSKAEAPEKFPGGTGAVMKLDYDFQPGWKYAPVYPGSPGKILEGRPGKEAGHALFGIWIYGDSGQLAPRLRVRDATGRTWQPTGPEIKWKGWKYVEMRLDATSAHWGGENAEEKRGPKFPLKWEAPFLLDNPTKVQGKGAVWFTMPVLILD